MLRLLLWVMLSSSRVIGCALLFERAGGHLHVVCFIAFHPVTLGASLREIQLVGLHVVAAVSGPLSCAGGFSLRELHRTLEASLAMFSFVRHFVGGQHEVVLVLVTASVSLSLLESQMLVFAMLVACIFTGVLVGCLLIDLE